MPHKPLTSPKLAVNAIVLKGKNEVLLAKRTDNGLWCIPGGHVELGETLSEACLRELREETGLEAEVVRLVGVYSDPGNSLHIRQGPEWHTVRVSFLCRATGGNLTASDETSEARYFNISDLPEMITDHAGRIRDASLDKPEAVIR